ncbi:ficolin-3-like [Clytia hemisphaerica]
MESVSLFFRFFFLIVIYGEITNAEGNLDSKYIRIGENVTLQNVESIHQTSVHSKSECLLLCQQKHCFISSIINTGSNWLCSLFYYIEKLSSKLVPYDTSLGGNSEVYQIDSGEVKDECLDWFEEGHKKSGVYWIGVEGIPIFQVFCDMDLEGGGWTVFQKRIDGSTNFNQSWNAYKNGFGNLKGDYWLGNKRIHKFTERSENTELVLYGRRFNGIRNYEFYNAFSIGNENTGYLLNSGTFKAGNTHSSQDWLAHNGKRFGTYDYGQEISCGLRFGGGWWYDLCYKLNFNGVYSNDGSVREAAFSLHWRYFSAHTESLKKTRMAMRRQKN